MSNLSAFAPRALAVLRIMAALLFLEHGTAKLFQFPMAQAGAPDPLPTMLLVAALVELVAGGLIALGLFTRLAAFVASGEMAVAYLIGHASQGFWPVGNGGDAAILYCFVFLYLVFAGPGSWALDNVRGRGGARVAGS
jgi:putative oxidoreductase